MAAPTAFQLRGCLRCFTDIIMLYFLANIVAYVACHFADGIEGYLLCRRCGNEIAKAADLLAIPSDLAHRQRNDTISGHSGVLIQLFRNPQGKFFEIITSAAAELQTYDKAYVEDSWFPGYTWTISLCPRCGYHIGWTFDVYPRSSDDSKQRTFVGMILDHILHENEADSIIAVPKAYTS
ncbi:uncharacterized protein LOC124256556 [Haliotis rubra]|uniref:uncharacterized protein LOC124256556 n=1 Tax=Haliotis rubra TaxID=36100 RepID=UPI001EE624C6|nr:uncharacterized protein LOC124256556 [Haliotis rubra]